MYLADILDDDIIIKNKKLFNDIVKEIKPASDLYRNIAQKRQNSLVKPPGSLGKLEDISIKLASIYQSEFYDISKKVVLAFGSDHGIYEEGISNQPQSVTALAFPNYVKGICSIGVLANFSDAKVVAVDVGINTDEKLENIIDRKIRKSTNNFSKEQAMTREEALLAICIGIEIANEYIEKGYRVIGLGEMGICNTSPSSAIISILTDRSVRDVTGLGAGTTSDKLDCKINAIEKGILTNKPLKEDSIDILSKVGGFEIGALLGVILACASKKIPVVLDGFISYASALLAKNIDPNTVDYMLASHKSAEPASQIALDELGLSAVLDMNMRLGEGSGAALFFKIMDAANEVYTKVATFDNAGVTDAGLER